MSETHFASVPGYGSPGGRPSSLSRLTTTRGKNPIQKVYSLFLNYFVFYLIIVCILFGSLKYLNFALKSLNFVNGTKIHVIIK